MKIYIASPYTANTEQQMEKNVYRSMVVADILMDLGITPILPLLTHYLHKEFPRDYDFWMNYDFELLKSCDALLRLKGKSEGANREVEFALNNNIIVFTNIKDLLMHIGIIEISKLC